ncbi:N-methyltransferase-like [Tropilaelaps mercedesae]|uniref:N-methyltransferase-like n=1 Tax=Tropilaelaps mercedesae TaxID=418985 RepID=A0A1V9X445_9ACAR|nr:N-methyltransferase-like [Tropilaelaps mercedesae]
MVRSSGGKMVRFGESSSLERTNSLKRQKQLKSHLAIPVEPVENFKVYVELRRRYREEFNAVLYQQLMREFGSVHRFFLECLHDFFSGHYASILKEEARMYRYPDVEYFDHLKMLDLGCGPSAYASLSGSAFIRNIVMADFTHANLIEINKWRNDMADAFDINFLAQVVAALENKSNVRDGGYEIIRRTKDSVSKTCRCDVTAPYILQESQNDARFDVVVSSTCLEAACLDVPTYENAVWKIAHQMLKPGGFFVQCGLTGTTGYTIGQTTFDCLPLTDDMVTRALDHAGLRTISFRHLRNQGHIYGDHFDSAFCIVAQRVMPIPT